MSRPKFQSRDARDAAELDLEPLGSLWDVPRKREQMRELAASLPAVTRPYFDIETAVGRSLGRRRHDAYLRRTGGMLNNWATEVHLTWDCCGREELLTDVRYDRHGNLRPEEIALIRARSYYHRCDA